MQTKALFISFILLIVGQAFAQREDRDTWKHRKEHYKKEMEWQREHDKKMAEHLREMRLRERELEHLEECHACDHVFYHNDGYYYENDLYYSRKTRRPITMDAEVVFRNGSIRVQL